MAYIKSESIVIVHELYVFIASMYHYHDDLIYWDDFFLSSSLSSCIQQTT